MKYLIACLALLCSAQGLTQNANFSTHDGRLEIPHLSIDYGIAYDDVELQYDANTRAFSLVDFEKGPPDWNQQKVVTLGFGESTKLHDEMTLTFSHVLADSRCPSDVTCITEGEVTVLLELGGEGFYGLPQDILFGMSLSGNDPGLVSDSVTQYLELKGLYFNLLEVSPFPVSTQTLADEDYEITLEVVAVPLPNVLVSPQ